ncbi:hypothetical protein BOTBODRAFT_118104, partial [Botryobasidium botryosum FD-172 SS1]
QGFFPCAPTRPSMAFHIDLLELITLQGHNAAPNATAWAETLENFWKRQQYFDSLRRCLANALQWYQILDYRTQSMVSNIVASSLAASGDTAGARAADFDTHQTRTATPVPTPVHLSTLTPTTTPDLLSASDSKSPKSTERQRPSAYLRSCCPNCFGGKLKPALKHSKYVHDLCEYV